jgi:predicted 2-oxoglutarate/Fe(II)-dependent dioxygenase YbiX
MGGLRLPHAQLRDFLPGKELGALLAQVLGNPEKFNPARIRSGDDSVVNADRRVALTSGDFGPLEEPIRQRFLDSVPAIMAATGASGPAPAIIEMELAAHGDGAFYSVHTDIPIGETRKRRRPEPDRVLSSVFYFHAEPKGFSGGELRLFGLGPDADHVDLQPVNNSLVVFHSWVPHEVLPVRCPSGEFRDYRFAINCWFRREPRA